MRGISTKAVGKCLVCTCRMKQKGKRMKSVEQFTQKEIEMMEFREKLFLGQVEQ